VSTSVDWPVAGCSITCLRASLLAGRVKAAVSEGAGWRRRRATRQQQVGRTSANDQEMNRVVRTSTHHSEFGIPRKQAWSNSVSQFRRGAEPRPVLHGTLGFLHAPVHRACNNNIATLLQLIRGEETLGFRNIIISVLMQLKAAMFTDSCMYAGIGVYKDSCESC
jgi:hypothetical protein